jgi:hypothetical protein
LLSIIRLKVFYYNIIFFIRKQTQDEIKKIQKELASGQKKKLEEETEKNEKEKEKKEEAEIVLKYKEDKEKYEHLKKKKVKNTKEDKVSLLIKNI